MKPLIIAFLLAAAPVLHGAESGSITFYVQLLRGSDEAVPPVPGAPLIGPKLGRRLHGIFKWKNYWEMKRESMVLKHGDTVRKQLSAERAVEIAWTGEKTMTVSIYTDGKITRKLQQPVDNTFYIAGGDKDVTGSWFIIVRRDTPEAGGGDASGPKAD